MKASVQADFVYTFKHGLAIVLKSIQRCSKQLLLIVLCCAQATADNASRKLQRKVLSFEALAERAMPCTMYLPAWSCFLLVNMIVPGRLQEVGHVLHFFLVSHDLYRTFEQINIMCQLASQGQICSVDGRSIYVQRLFDKFASKDRLLSCIACFCRHREVCVRT